MSLKKKFLLKRLSWRADDLNDYCGPLVHRQFVESLAHADMYCLIRAAAEAVGGADIIFLQKQPQYIATFQNPFVSSQAIAYHVGAHSTLLATSWDTYFKGKRSAKTRRRLKEKFSALSKLGQVDMRIVDSIPEATRLVEICLDLKAGQLRKLGHRNPFHSSGARALLVDYFGSRIAEDTWVAALYVSGQPAAIAFGFRDRESWLLYQTAMTGGRLGNLSPGTHLLMHVIKHCCEHGVRVFDLSLGDEHYKTEWCEQTTPLMTDVVGISTLGRLFSHCIRAKSTISRWISSKPALYEIAKRTKGRLGSMRHPT